MIIIFITFAPIVVPTSFLIYVTHSLSLSFSLSLLSRSIYLYIYLKHLHFDYLKSKYRNVTLFQLEMSLGFKAIANGDYKEAYTCFARALNLNPANTVANINAAVSSIFMSHRIYTSASTCISTWLDTSDVRKKS